MLEKVRAALTPRAVLVAEMDEIEAKLAELAPQHEEARLAVGRAAVALTVAGSQVTDREAKGFVAAFSEIDGQVAALRSRRRAINATLRPDTPVAARLVDVPLSRDLVSLQSKLDAAREEHRAAIRTGAGESVKEQRAFNARLDALQGTIRDLRAKREVLLVPHHAAVDEALRPIVAKAASDLVNAAQAFIAAHAVLAEAALLAPVRVGGSSRLAHVAGISTYPALQAEKLGAELLAVSPPDMDLAAE